MIPNIERRYQFLRSQRPRRDRESRWAVKGCEHLCTTRWMRNNTVKNNLLTIVGTMSICWGLSDPPPFSHGWKREEEFTVIRAPHWPCIDHFRFDFMRLATVTVGENVPFYRWHGRNFRIHDTFFFPFFTSINFVPQHEGMIEKRNARCVCEGKILSFLSPLFLVRRRGAIRGLWKIRYPRRGVDIYLRARL